jgi:hypothetical protein
MRRKPTLAGGSNAAIRLDKRSISVVPVGHFRPHGHSIYGFGAMSRSDYSVAPTITQTCPQCGAEMRLARKEQAPGSPTLERLFFECKCGHTAGRMQAKPAAKAG